MYTTERYESKISAAEYLEHYVDVPTFLEACKACPNYERVWSCPPYDFDVEAYWKQYRELHLLATKIVFDETSREKKYSQDDLEEMTGPVLASEKQKLSDELMELEKQYPGSISLSAGCCRKCTGGCTRPEGSVCRFPQQMRYSIESLGGNVGMTIEKLMGIKLKWMEEGRLPEYFVLVSGLLVK